MSGVKYDALMGGLREDDSGGGSGGGIPEAPIDGTGYVRKNAAWAAESAGGTGDFVGPASAVDSNFVAFDTTTGKKGKDSGSKAADFATAAQGAKADTALQPTASQSISNKTIGTSNVITGRDDQFAIANAANQLKSFFFSASALTPSAPRHVSVPDRDLTIDTVSTNTDTAISAILKGTGTKVAAASAGTDYVAPGAVTSNGVTMSTARLLGRYSASTGAVQEVQVGTGLDLSGAGVLTATGGGGAYTDYSVRLRKSTGQSIGTTRTAMTFDVEDFDTDGMHDNSTNNTRITFTHSGRYLVGGLIATDGNAYAGGSIRVDGTTEIARAVTGNAASSVANGVFLSTPYYFTAGQYVELLGTFGTTQTSTSGVDGCNFWATYVGASSSGGGRLFDRVEVKGPLTDGLITYQVAHDAGSIAGVKITVTDLPTGSSVKVDIRKNGTATTNSIFTSDTEAEITTGTGATNGVYTVTKTAIDNGTFVADDVVRYYITLKGSTLPGTNLSIVTY